MTRYSVAILMGSDSDLEVMNEAASILKEFGVSYDVKVLSAHRSPEEVRKYVKGAGARGIQIFICGAGGAAHLAGTVAAQTTLPVIGVPMNSSLSGLDSLLSTVSMPGGIPVATVAIGKTGARNAGILACQILALKQAALQKKLEAFKKKMVAGIRRKNEMLKKELQRR